MHACMHACMRPAMLWYMYVLCYATYGFGQHSSIVRCCFVFFTSSAKMARTSKRKTATGDAVAAAESPSRRISPRTRHISSPSAKVVTPDRPVAPRTVSRGSSINVEGGATASDAASATSSSRTPHATLDLPARFSLAQSICSYGYFGLAPNQWAAAPDSEHEDRGIFTRPIAYGTKNKEECAAVVRVEQIDNTLQLTMVGGTAPESPEHIQQVLLQIHRILRLDWSPDSFWGMHPEAKARGFGRTYRSPTLWEDMVKTLTNCNMKWSGTCVMNTKLCANVGHAIDNKVNRHNSAIEKAAQDGSNAELERLIDTASTPVFGVDTAGNINAWNGKIANIIGFTEEEALEKSLVKAFLVKKCHASVKDVLNDAILGRETTVLELLFHTKSKITRSFFMNAFKQCDIEGKTIGAVFVTQGLAAFPTPQQVAAKSPEWLQKHCRLGYRAPWVHELAKKFLSGEIDTLQLEDADLTREEIFKRIVSLKGFAKFAANNVLQLLGRHDAHPYDTETTRLFREQFKVSKSVPVAAVHEQAKRHYEKYAPHQFLAYWFDLWQNYEVKNGRKSTRWDIKSCQAL